MSRMLLARTRGPPLRFSRGRHRRSTLAAGSLARRRGEGERALRARPNSWRPVRAHGAETNRRWIVALDGGESAFVKLAATDEGADWLRNERTVYRSLTGAPFLPRLIGWHDDGERPALAIEDLSGAE